MTLTKNDRMDIKDIVRDTIIEAMEQLMLPRFDEQNRRFDVIEKDIAELKNDVRVLKDDVRILKEDTQVLKDDVRILKEDVRVLKGDMREVKSALNNLDGRAEALENDIKELYKLQTGHDNIALTDKKFAKLPLEEKLLIFNTELQKMAEQAGFTLPR